MGRDRDGDGGGLQPLRPHGHRTHAGVLFDRAGRRANGRVDSVTLRGDEIIGTRKDNSKFKAYNPETDNTALIGVLDKANVDFKGEPPKQPNFLMQLLLQLAPALLLILVFVYMMRQMQGRPAAAAP